MYTVKIAWDLEEWEFIVVAEVTLKIKRLSEILNCGISKKSGWLTLFYSIQEIKVFITFHARNSIKIDGYRTVNRTCHSLTRGSHIIFICSPFKNAKDTRTTWLPTKDDTSETTVRNVYCLVSCIYDSLQLFVFLAKSLSTPLKAIFRAEDRI